MRHKKTPLAIIILVIFFFCGDAHPQQPLSLISSLNIPGRVFDLWMYTDTSSNEHILIGSDSGLYIIDVSVPQSPKLESFTRMYTTFWGKGAFDIKIFNQYAYIVSGSGLDTGYIYNISDPKHPSLSGTFPDAHNIYISSQGYLISEGSNMKIFDLNQTPTLPALVHSSTDGFGHDAAVIEDRLFDFHDNAGTKIYSTANLQNPQLLGHISTTITGYSHSGWPTEDGNYLMMSCEICEQPDISFWDISDLNNIILTDTFNDDSTYTHNIQIKGSYAFVSNYEKGLRVFKISDPFNIRLVAEYDPVPGGGSGYGGTFGVYVFSSSGYIFTSDDYEGLMVFEFDSSQVSIQQISREVPGDFKLHQNYPNPFNPETKIKFEIPKMDFISLKVYNMSGKEVASFVNNELQAGVYEYSFDGSGLGSGVYFYKLQSEDFVETRRMVLVK